MRWKLRCALALLAVSLALVEATPATPPSHSPDHSDSFAVTRVRVFDGSRVIPRATVVVVNGRIQAVGADVAPPRHLAVIDGAGSTLLPGLIDSHAHAKSRDDLERAAHFGVTTEMDMWSPPGFAQSMRREQDHGDAFDRADLFSAINPATPPEGYPYILTGYVETPTLSGPEEAEAFVAARVAEGSDYLKIMMEDGMPLFGFEARALSRPTVRALTRAIHRHGKLAVAHATERYRALELLGDGVDGLVHVFIDEPADPGFIRLAVAKKIFVAPTLAVTESFIDPKGELAIVEDPDLAPWMSEWEVRRLLAPPPPTFLTLKHLAIAKENVRLLHAAGVPILAGTDKTVHGVPLHRDLELLVQAGLRPIDALAAATSAPAAAFNLRDRGRIAPGLRADLLLVKGNPAADIKATRRIQKIWKAGVEVERPVPAASFAR